MKLVDLGSTFGEEEGFYVFGFIDNTMNATWRPGGGPARDGVNVPRNEPLKNATRLENATRNEVTDVLLA